MPDINIVVECASSTTRKAQQLSALFDVPMQQKQSRSWKMTVPLHERDWNVGLIVGPSGSGKTTIARELFGLSPSPEWSDERSVIDDFDLPVQQTSDICQAVGFNTIPAWLRPYSVLSNGEKFRVDLARLLAIESELICVDEYSSVVDRQVAQIASNAVQKYVRRNKKQFVAVSCHEDLEDWLQPDWILRPATQEFYWRSLRRRPDLNIEIAPVPYSTWEIFAPYHYLTADLNKGARCWGLWCNGKLASFWAVLNQPISNCKTHSRVIAGSRLVTLPDYQGLGLAFVLLETVASVYKAMGLHVHTRPALPSLIRSLDKNPKWELRKKPGTPGLSRTPTRVINYKGRTGASFRYSGPAMDKREAEKLLSFWNGRDLISR